MTEPSAWSEHVVMALIRDCVDHTPLPPPCATCVRTALDAAWRAGAEATRRRDRANLGVDGQYQFMLDGVLLPAPGEER